jgi:hypothetical protein
MLQFREVQALSIGPYRLCYKARQHQTATYTGFDISKEWRQWDRFLLPILE